MGSSGVAAITNAAFTLPELQAEALMGGEGTTADRPVPVIDMSNFDERRVEIGDQLWAAATEVGFFQLKNHGISAECIDRAFSNAAQFFQLPEQVKAQYPLRNNAGFESRGQVRPSTGKADQKESYQITRPRMHGLWPSETELPGWQAEMLAFEQENWEVSQRVLALFEERIGLPRGAMRTAHDARKSEYQSTLRMLHYFAQTEDDIKQALPRAGPHTDFDVLTCLHQRNGQFGLEVASGLGWKQGEPVAWTPVEPVSHLVTCNVGDMLARWSDGRLKSTLHRVRSPRRGEALDARYSLVFFAQANTDVPLVCHSHPTITAGEYIAQRVAANYAAAGQAATAGKV